MPIRRYSTTYLALVALSSDDLWLALALTGHDVAGGADGAQVVAAASCKSYKYRVERIFFSKSDILNKFADRNLTRVNDISERGRQRAKRRQVSTAASLIIHATLFSLSRYSRDSLMRNAGCRVARSD